GARAGSPAPGPVLAAPPAILSGRGASDTHGRDMRSSTPASSAAADLVARIARRDREAFERLYDSHASLAFGLIRRVLRDWEAAEEVLQEVFWQVWQGAGPPEPAPRPPQAALLM